MNLIKQRKIILRKGLLLSVLLYFWAPFNIMAQANMNVKQSNNPDTSYALQGIKKLIFSGNTMSVYQSCDTTSYQLNFVNHLDFDTSLITRSPEQSFIPELLLFPNPVSQLLNIKYTLKETSKVSIKIFDIYGKVVYEGEEADHTGQYQFQVNTSNLSSGIFAFQLVSGKAVINKLFIKN